MAPEKYLKPRFFADELPAALRRGTDEKGWIFNADGVGIGSSCPPRGVNLAYAGGRGAAYHVLRQ